MFDNYQQWVREFYSQRGWYGLSPSIRLNFLVEEVGELSQAMRNYEIGRDRPDEEELSREEKLNHIKEELGDVLDNIVILADTYGLDMRDIIQDHIDKIESRYR